MKNSAQHGSPERGVSLLEVLIVIAIILVVSAAAIINILGSLKVAASDTAAQLVQQDMRLARQAAISNRLVYRLSFYAPSGIVLDQLVTDTVMVSGAPSITTTVNNISNDSVPSTVSFQILSGTPVDLDGFCSCLPSPGICSCTPQPSGTPLVPTVAIDFNGSNQIFFQPDGAGRDANGKICNGVVYSAISGQLLSSRVVTVWGSTGQIKLYKLFASAGGYYWK
jgi:prepilin-type N-terminal cleavage/methylation domain-containing protein